MKSKGESEDPEEEEVGESEDSCPDRVSSQDISQCSQRQEHVGDCKDSLDPHIIQQDRGCDGCCCSYRLCDPDPDHIYHQKNVIELFSLLVIHEQMIHRRSNPRTERSYDGAICQDWSCDTIIPW